MGRMIGINFDVVGLFQRGHQTHVEPLSTVCGGRVRSVGFHLDQTRDFPDHGLRGRDEFSNLCGCSTGFEFE